MPSGSKRRKAAKKKKEKEAPISDSSSTNTNNSNTHENDEVRSHDEKDSDGGEPNSPASHDHHGPFSGGIEELGKSDPLPVASADVENKPVAVPVDSDAAPKIEVDGNGEVETVKEVKFEDDSPISIECVEPMKEKHDEGNEKSSFFGSDGESLVAEEKFGVEEGSENLKTSQFEDLEKPGESLPQELTEVIDGAPDEDVNVAETVVSLSEKVIDLTDAAPSDNKADFELNSRGKEDLLPSMDEVQQVASSGLEFASNNVGAKVFPVSVENSGVESGALTSVSMEKEGELLPSSGVLVAQTDNGMEKVKDLEVYESNNGLESASNNVGVKVFPVSVENSGVESGAVTSVSVEKEGELLPSSGVLVAQTNNGTQKARDFEVCESNNGLESASNNVGAIVFPVSVENSGVESGAVTSVSKEKEGEMLPSSGISVAQAHNGTKKAKDFEVCESSEDQPLVAPAPRIAEKRSWMSCCGLFDVFMGSSR
ncbi:translocase of chloroplast 120, chloroplastic-like isoform X2 [Rhodamnia argentea]|uniref:Translocase of chloroplast 120, chloroplastic-like isoform X2 n=1 Tax=Rhodamnia argentea TaxID=178133 RepID=A0ABM3HX21_9MYRT|nr:translocase of chloroplast 120, chloroplastic-like isoform X2 [Rhodamnia argentea]